MKTTHSRTRRGVLLLVVLGLLAMFGLVAVAFVVVTGHARRGAKTVERIEQYADPPDEQLHQIAVQVLRGSHNPASVLGPHSLLEDIYGDRSVPGVMDDAIEICRGQIIEFAADPRLPNPQQRVGCVLTMRDGPAAGGSTRIVGCRYVDGTPRFQIVAFDGVQTADLLAYVVSPDNVCNYVINGTAFSGPGLGYNQNTGEMDLTDGNGLPLALLPRPFLSRREYQLWLFGPDEQPNTGDERPIPVILANEDYDAVDYQNMLLGAQIQTPTGIATIPSLHRPALVNFWIEKLVKLTGPETNPDGTVADYGLDMNLWGPMNPGQKRNALSAPYGADNLAETGARGWPFDPVLAEQIVALKRKIILRPLPEDHPNFDGGNPNFRLPAGGNDVGQVPGFHPIWDGTFGPPGSPNDMYPVSGATYGDGICDYRWDVDNDNDGVTDSIWVDVGLPVRSTSDGRLYKPLAAILCLDLDGRLNVNAHGTLAQTQNGGADSYYAEVMAGTFGTGNYPYMYAGGGANPRLPRGQGYGPAEINLRPLFGNALLQYEQLLIGNNMDLEGRYGQFGAAPLLPGPGTATDEPLSFNKHFDLPYNFLTQLTSYGTLPDFKGTLAVGLDLRGQPLLPGVNSNLDATVLLRDQSVHDVTDATPDDPHTFAAVNDPYELDLTRRDRGQPGPTSVDNPFSFAELERILRPFDHDANRLPSRLAALTSPDGLPNNSVLLNRRFEVTTDSWDVPVPGPSWFRPSPLPGRPRGPAEPMAHISELLKRRIWESSQSGRPNEAEVWEMMRTLLPLEMLGGLKMDLNRPFGNGMDDNGNGVVDEPGRVILRPNPGPSLGNTFLLDSIFPGEIHEARNPGVREQMRQVDATGNTIWPIFDHINGVNVNGDPSINDADRALARQLYARHLYVLMMLLSDPLPASQGQAQEARARTIAQWAVNVVDFCDRDSIMTPFEYDIFPFAMPRATSPGGPQGSSKSTWNVDGVIGTSDDNEGYRRLVWGCERPELLISETLAFHDFRTEDLDVDGKKPVPPEVKGDADFDQRWRPEGSLFVELYNPWSEFDGPSDFYWNRDANRFEQGVRLQQRADNGDPVWRLAVFDTRRQDMIEKPRPNMSVYRDPDGPNPPTPERTIYFVGSAANRLGNLDEAKVRYLPQDGGAAVNRIAPILPGRYALIGPGYDPNDQNVSKQPNRDTVSETYLGYPENFGPDSAPPPDQRRRIRLEPSEDPDVSPQVIVKNSPGVDPGVNDVPDPNDRNPIAVVINRAIDESGADVDSRMSISEPKGGYSFGINYTNDPNTPALDIPADRMNRSLDPPYTADEPSTTVPNIKVICLQRLANPLLPYDSDANPYRTIDIMPVDLTVFNGLDEHPVRGGDEALVTHQRGKATAPNQPPQMLWPYEPAGAGGGGKGIIPGQYYFKGNLDHTLGFLNSSYGDPYGLPPDPAAPAGYRGDPRQPFPWFNWNNRPFINAMELALVPRYSSARLLDPNLAFRMQANADPYAPTDDTQNGPFNHLLNFYQSADAPGVSPQWHRLFDFVGVPSRFVGTELQADPTTFATSGGHSFAPPFNKISRFREPGRVNINTVFSKEVWRGLINYFPEMDPGAYAWRWQAMVNSRRGYGGNASASKIDPDYPTRFVNPFRSASGAHLVPLDAMKVKIGPEVNSTLLRKFYGSNKPLFSFDKGYDPDAPSISEVNDTDRNPYFRYQGLQRLGNLVTTRSNVYAVWITVGYFEVEQPDRPELDPAEYQDVYPDGFALGQELGIDTGEVKRHRAFYIFDRTIPVGFVRGEDLNVGKAIMLKRMIE